MTPFQQIHSVNPTLAKEITMQGFFMDVAQVRKVAEHPSTRLTMIMVRCGSGRFVCPAQNVEHFINIIDREKTDYVRDISVQNH
jgi:hypothetical protein